MSKCIPHELFSSITYCVNTNYGNVTGKTSGSINEQSYSSMEHNDDYSYFKFTDYTSGTILDYNGIYIIRCQFPEGTDKSKVKFDGTYQHTVNMVLRDGTTISKNYDADHPIQIIWTLPNVCWIKLTAQQLATEIKHMSGAWANGIRVNIACTCEFFKMYDELCVTDSDFATWFKQLPTLTETKTITLQASVLKKLSDATKKIATDKGWTLA